MRSMSLKERYPNKTQVAIVITDGMSNVNSLDTIVQAKLARDAGIAVIAIGLQRVILPGMQS